MKTCKKPIVCSLPFVNLNLDDLEDINKLLENNNCRDIKFENEEFEFKFNEISKLRTDELKQLKISCYDPYLCIDIDNISYSRKPKIYCGSSDTKSVGIVKQIEDIFKNKKRHFFNLIGNQYHLLIILMISCSILIVSNNFLFQKIVVFLILITFLFFIISSGFIFNLNIISLIKTKNQSNFFKKNKDQIIVGIIVAIVTVAITLMLTSIF